jgi:hypothetical protein
MNNPITAIAAAEMVCLFLTKKRDEKPAIGIIKSR